MHNAHDDVDDDDDDADRDDDSDVESLVLGSPNAEAVAAITGGRAGEGNRRRGRRRSSAAAVVGLGVTNASTGVRGGAGVGHDVDDDDEEEEEAAEEGGGVEGGIGGGGDEEDEIDEDIMKQMEDVLEDHDDDDGDGDGDGDQEMEDVAVPAHVAHLPAQIEEEESEVSEEE